MTRHVIDRRRHRRLRADEHRLQFARIRPGHDVSILDVSAGGMLVESIHRLLPGTRVDVRVLGEQQGDDVIRGRVVRCAVAHLQADQIAYRGAIAFDRQCIWVGNSGAHGYVVPGSEAPPNHTSRVPTTRDLL
jgi:hypothetical protein